MKKGPIIVQHESVDLPIKIIEVSI